METKILIPAIGWGVLALAVIALAIYRMAIASREDDQLHLRQADMTLTNTQSAFAHKLEQIDRTGKTLTVLAVVYGAALLAWVIRDTWVNSLMPPK